MRPIKRGLFIFLLPALCAIDIVILLLTDEMHVLEDFNNWVEK